MRIFEILYPCRIISLIKLFKIDMVNKIISIKSDVVYMYTRLVVSGKQWVYHVINKMIIDI